MSSNSVIHEYDRKAPPYHEYDRKAPPYRFLTDEDREEMIELDLAPSEFIAWRWKRAVHRMCEAFKRSLGRPTKATPEVPRINYHEWWRSDQLEKAKRRKARRDAARHAANAEKKRAEREAEERGPLGAIKREAAQRLRLLKKGTKRPRGDKRLEQLRGREKAYVQLWHAMQLAELMHGSAASAAKIALVYMEHHGNEKITRDQVRTRSKVILELEQPGGIWAPEKLMDCSADREAA